MRVAWNEQHAPMGELGCACGLDDEVPKEWLREVTPDEARQIEARYWIKRVRRLGRFRVSFALMDEWPTLLPAMGQVVVVRAECRYDSRTVDYVAYSHHFDVVAEGAEPPEYTATFTRHENGLVTVKWEREKDWRHESPDDKLRDGATERRPSSQET